MEVFAGFVEHVDVQVGRVVDELDRLGIRDNTIVIYIFGDNGASAEGQNGTISELLAQNGIPNTVEQQIAALDKIGGLEALGSPKTESMYHAGWAWAGNTPFQYTKLIASHFGGTRNPMVISWPKGIKPDRIPRSQFHHVNDIVPTIYEIVGIKPPKMVDGFPQDPIDGISLAYTFNDPKAPSRKKVQYFDNNGSRAIYNDGWIAATFGPLVPWLPGAPGLAEWDSAKDKWELYHISKDFSEADDLAGKEPKRLAELQTVFDAQAKANKVYPLGAGIWLRLHPEDRIKTPYTSWRFDTTTTRMPEFTAPSIGHENNTVTIDAELGENASGVLYALGGAGGGVTLYMDKGDLVFEYNMMIIERYIARSASKLAAGKRRIEVTTQLESPKPLSPADVVLKVDGQEIARTKVKRTVPAAFSASETFDVGVDLGSIVSLDYYDRCPFRFDGKIEKVEVKLN
jgi:arylsulfatase